MKTRPDKSDYYFTLVDWAMRVSDGPIHTVVRAVCAGLVAYALSVMPLLVTGHNEFVGHPLLVISAVGVSWVTFCSMLVNTQRRVVETMSSFAWSSNVSAFRERYFNFLNNHITTVIFSLIAWCVFQAGTILPLVYGDAVLSGFDRPLRELVPTSYIPIRNLADQGAIPFLIAQGIGTFLGALVAISAARFIRGQFIYLALLNDESFDAPLARLRAALKSHIAVTLWICIAFSTGIVVFLLALDLETRNPTALLLIGGVIVVVVYSYLEVVSTANTLNKARAEKVIEKILPHALTSAPAERLEIEHRFDVVERLSEPVVDILQSGRSVVSISAPFALILIEDPLKWLWASFVVGVS